MLVLRAIVAIFRAVLARRSDLVMENLALRHQLNLFRRKVGRPRLRKSQPGQPMRMPISFANCGNISSISNAVAHPNQVACTAETRPPSLIERPLRNPADRLASGPCGNLGDTHLNYRMDH